MRELGRCVVRAALGLLLLPLLLAACGDNQDPAGAGRLWRELHDMEYRTWDRAPGYEMRRRSDAPNGGRVDIYVNDVVAEALAGREALRAWPTGSIIVKDGFDGSDLTLVAAMEKRDDGVRAFALPSSD